MRDNAKRKVLKPRWWAGETETTVYLDLIPQEQTYGSPYRHFNVYAENGRHLGTIDEYEGRIDTPLSRRSRLVHHGKTRTFWAVNGQDYWKYLPSQAEAIRQLLNAVKLVSHNVEDD